MAAESTPTTNSTRQLAYALGREALPANLPKVVIANLANDDDILGQPTLVKQYAVESDLGIASPGTYGTDISTNTELTYGSAVQLTITEGALIKATIDDTSLSVENPGMGEVNMAELLGSGNIAAARSLLQPKINRLAAPCMEKWEDDHCNLLTGFSNSAGDSGLPLTVAHAFSALYVYDTLEAVTEETAWAFAPVQVRDLMLDIAVNGGGLGAGVWNSTIDASFLRNNGLSPNGFKGTFMNRPLYQYSHSLRTLSDGDANVNGALMAIGRGKPDEGGQLGAIAHARRGLLQVRLEATADGRGVKVVLRMEYGVGEVRDTHAVRMRSKAT